MALAGLSTRKAAIDYALTQAERAAKLAQLFARPWTQQELDAALEPGYDLEALRERDKPQAGPCGLIPLSMSMHCVDGRTFVSC